VRKKAKKLKTAKKKNKTKEPKQHAFGHWPHCKDVKVTDWNSPDYPIQKTDY